MKKQFDAGKAVWCLIIIAAVVCVSDWGYKAFGQPADPDTVIIPGPALGAYCRPATCFDCHAQRPAPAPPATQPTTQPVEPPPPPPRPDREFFTARAGSPVFIRPDGSPNPDRFGFIQTSAPDRHTLYGPLTAYVWDWVGDKQVTAKGRLPAMVRVTADTRVVLKVQGDSLEALLKRQAANVVYLLPNDVEQTIRSRVDVLAADVEVRGPGTINVVGARDSYRGIYVLGDRFTLRGVKVVDRYTGVDRRGSPSVGVAFEKNGGGLVRDCTFEGVDVGVKASYGNKPVLILNGKTVRNRGYGILGHAAAGVVVDGGHYTSINEHPLRLMGWDGLTASPRDWTVAHGRYERTATATKEALTFRSGSRLSLHDCTLINGFGLRIGIAGGDVQLPSPQLRDVSIRDVLLERCAFWVYGGNSGNGVDGLYYDGLRIRNPSFVNAAKQVRPAAAVNVEAGSKVRNVVPGRVTVE